METKTHDNRSASENKGGSNGDTDKRPKNRFRSKREKGNSNSNSKNNSKFTGLNKDELEGIVISETNPAPTAQQFDTLMDAIVVHAGSRNARVKTSLRNGEHPTKQDPRPAPPDPSEHSDSNGKEDSDMKSACIEIWKSECTTSNKQCNKCKESIEGLFETIIGQLDKEVLNNLKGMTGWKAIDESNDTLALLKNLKEPCCRDDSSKIHPVSDPILKLLRFTQSRQNEKSAASFVEECTNRSDALKSAGGSIASPAVIKHTLKTAMKGKLTHQVCLKHKASTDPTKMATAEEVDEKARDVVLAHVAIRGSNDKHHQNLRLELEKDCAKGHDNHPANANEALDLLNECKAKNTRPNQNDRNNGNRGDKNDKEQKEKQNTKNDEGRQLTTVGESSSASQPTTDEVEQAHQLLMKATDDCETENDHMHDSEFCFPQHSDTNEDNQDDPPSILEIIEHLKQEHNDRVQTFDATEMLTIEEMTEREHTDNDPNTCGRFDHVSKKDKEEPKGQNKHDPSDNGKFTPERINNNETNNEQVVIVKSFETLSDSKNHNAETASERERDDTEHANKTDPDCAEAVHKLQPERESRCENHEIQHAHAVENEIDSNKSKQDDPQKHRSAHKHKDKQAKGRWQTAATLELDELEKLECFVPTKTSTSHNLNDVWMFAQNQGGKVDPCWILLDSQASCNATCNKNLVTDIRGHPHGKTIAIHCNAGSVKIGTIANLRGFGQVWFHEECIANCPSLALVSDMLRITLDTEMEQAFVVHKENGDCRKFHRVDCNPCVCDVRKLKDQSIFATAAEDQKKSYSKRDIERAERARKTQKIMMFPSERAFMDMVDNNLINNCGVTRRDMQIAKETFGVDAGMAKGKTARQNPREMNECLMPVPPEILRNCASVTLAIDSHCINGPIFFRSVSRHPMHRITKPIGNRRKETTCKNLKRMMSGHRNRGFRVTQTHGDNEFACVADDLMEDFHTAFCPVARGAHEPHIERDNRTSKERCRCAFNSLPFEHWPARMTIELVLAVDFWSNCWCSSGGVSRAVPPREISTGIKLDASAHCKHQFGDLVPSHEESNDSMAPRVKEGIHLRPTGNPDGGFCAFDLSTARRVRRCAATPAHLTQSITDKAHNIAIEQRAPVGMTFGGFDNNITILDPDNRSAVPEDEDDDNASDQSCATEDDQTVETELTGFESESEDKLDDRMIGDADESVTSQRNDIPDVTVDTEDASVDDEIVEDDEAPEDETQEEDTEDVEAPIARRLRATVRPPQRDTSEGFDQKTQHRNENDFFTHGFSKAAQQLCKRESHLLFVAQVIDHHNQAEASKATPQHGITKGLKMFGKAGTEAVLKEMKQLNDLEVMSPCKPNELTKEDMRNALPHLMLPKRKRCGKVKGRGCADGRAQREFISKDEASSPTASSHAVMISSLMDAIEERHAAAADIPGALLQTDSPPEDKTHMRTQGAMAELLCSTDPKKYEKSAIATKKGTKTVCTRASKALCGTLKAALLLWKKLRGTLESWGCTPDPCDPCTMNKMIEGSQAAAVFHADDLKISHRSKSVVEAFVEQLNKEFGKMSPVTSTMGEIHEHSGMTIDCSTKHKAKFAMHDHLEDIVAGMPDELKSNRTFATPAADHLFEVNEEAEKLDARRAETLHHCVAKLLFASKRARPDIQTAVAFPCTRAKCPDVDDWKKPSRPSSCPADTPFLPLTIRWDETGNMCWCVDASFGTHVDMKSHTGGMLAFGHGAMISVSTKQKISTKSSTEAEIAGVDDVSPLNIWCRNFPQQQGYQANDNENNAKCIGHANVLHQDNTSSIELETSGRSSCSKRTRHINLRYFLICDKLKSKEVDTIEHCPTDELISDCFTKPLQGSKFKNFRNAIMGVSDADCIRLKIECNDRKQSNARN